MFLTFRSSEGRSRDPRGSPLHSAAAWSSGGLRRRTAKGLGFSVVQFFHRGSVDQFFSWVGRGTSGGRGYQGTRVVVSRDSEPQRLSKLLCVFVTAAAPDDLAPVIFGGSVPQEAFGYQVDLKIIKRRFKGKQSTIHLMLSTHIALLHHEMSSVYTRVELPKKTKHGSHVQYRVLHV